MLEILVWLFAAWNALGAIYVLHRAFSKLPKLNPNNLVHYLHHVDWPLLESLLDPAVDFELRWRLSPRAFREEQRERMSLYREQLWRMARNSAVVAKFDNILFGKDDFSPGPGSKVEEAAIKVRFYCTVARVKLRIWLSLPDAFGFMPTPNLARLRKAGNVDGLKAYEELKAAALEAFAKLQPDELEALTRNL
jgi:hypothetical protein